MSTPTDVYPCYFLFFNIQYVKYIWNWVLKKCETVKMFKKCKTWKKFMRLLDMSVYTECCVSAKWGEIHVNYRQYVQLNMYGKTGQDLELKTSPSLRSFNKRWLWCSKLLALVQLFHWRLTFLTFSQWFCWLCHIHISLISSLSEVNIKVNGEHPSSSWIVADKLSNNIRD